MLNRANNLPLKPEDKQQEEMIIEHMAKANGYPTKLIKNLQKKRLPPKTNTVYWTLKPDINGPLSNTIALQLEK
jgi:hypothetical protein